MNLEELEKKIEKNANRITSNADRINSNLERIEKNSYTLDILKDYKTDSKRLFVILIIVLAMWFATIGYLVYVLRDTGTIEETTTQEINDVNTINGSVVNEGDICGEDKTNS